jgi:hypothetical protein
MMMFETAEATLSAIKKYLERHGILIQEDGEERTEN